MRQYLFILLLVAPSAIYFAFAWWQRQRAVQAGQDMPPPLLNSAPWFWLILTGVMLFGVALVLWALLAGAPPGSVYVPPHTEDGQVVPGYFIQDSQ